MAQARREKGVRERRDVLQSDLAEAVGVGAATVSRWESGGAVPRDDALDRAARYLGVTPAYLKYGVMEPQIPESVRVPDAAVDRAKAITERAAGRGKAAAKKGRRQA